MAKSRLVRAADAITLWHGMAGSRAKLMVGSDLLDHVELWDWHIAVRDGYVSDAHVWGRGNLVLWWQERWPLGVEGHVEHARAGDAVLFKCRPRSRVPQWRHGGV